MSGSGKGAKKGPKISNRQQTKLYNSVHKDVMDARVEINMLMKEVIKYKLDKPALDKIDNILSDLCIKAPQNAINLFTKKP